MDEHRVGGVLEPQDVVGVEDAFGLGDVDAHAEDDLAFFGVGGVADVDLEQEAVALGLGQG
ncbi:hypothetical protein GCM10029992_42100 [Glycomyces albus]